MTSRRPPRLIEALLRRLPADREPLIGDLLEEFQQGRSAPWLWRQVLSASALDLLRPRGPLTLGLDGTVRRDATPPAPRMIGVGGIGSRHVGGLGVLALAVLMATVAPQIWWLLVAAIAGGAAFGAVLVLIRRRSIGVLAFVLASTVVFAQAPVRPAVPLEPVAAILDAFRSHQVVIVCDDAPGAHRDCRVASC